ncbi:MAG: hypothetical protein PVI91_09065 [Gammaproteobacteria bacterium]|jgi:hypothetical protein
MKKYALTASVFAVTSLALSVSAGSFDGGQPLICASTEIMECIPGEGCNRVAADSVNAPQFMRIDFDAGSISSERSDGSRRISQIERHEIVDGKLMLQGAEDGVEDVRDGLGWTLSIAQETGRMTLSGSGDAVGFVIFGACTAI